MTTTTVPSARDQLLADLFTTALEGGIGYWSSCSLYHWMDAAGAADLAGFRAELTEDETGDRLVVDRTVVARGYRLATSADWRRRIAWSTEAPPVVVTEDSDWDYDAGDADVIVQLGLFGEVVYG